MFKKYPSIENHYNEKQIKVFLNEFPYLNKWPCCIQEKLHGCNLQFIFNKDNTFQIASRETIIDKNSDFYDIWDYLENGYIIGQVTNIRVSEFIQILKERFKGLNANVYMELIGNGITQKIKYILDPKYKLNLRIFHCQQGGQDIPPRDLFWFLQTLKLNDYIIPHFVLHSTLENGLNFDTRINSSLTPKDFPSEKLNLIEGVVIKPWNSYLINNGGKCIMLKKKNPEFLEKGKGEKKEREPIPDKVEELKIEFLNYLNENRIQSCFSKIGPIKDRKDLGKYIKFILDDMKEDFLKEFNSEINNIDKKFHKNIFNIGNDITKFLLKSLGE